MGSELPGFSRPRPTLEVLGVVAAVMATASAASHVFALLQWVTAIAACLAGSLWVLTHRVTKLRPLLFVVPLPLIWVMAPVLTFVSEALLGASDNLAGVDAIVALVVGFAVSIPATVFLAVVLGLPQHDAVKATTDGARERATLITGLATATVGVFAALAQAVAPSLDAWRHARQPTWDAVLGFLVCLIATVLGATVVARVVRTRQQRHRFIEEVRAGKHDGLRVEMDEGKVVIAKVVSEGGYRTTETREIVDSTDDDASNVAAL